MEGGDERQAVIDHAAQSLSEIEDRDGIKLIERLVEDHEGMTASQRCGNRNPLVQHQRTSLQIID